MIVPYVFPSYLQSRKCIWQAILAKVGSVAKITWLLMYLRFRATTEKWSLLLKGSKHNNYCPLSKPVCTKPSRSVSWNSGSKSMIKSKERRCKSIWPKKKKLSLSHHTLVNLESRCMSKWQLRRKRSNVRKTHKNTNHRNRYRCTQNKVRLGSVTRENTNSASNSTMIQIIPSSKSKCPNIWRPHSWKSILIQSGLASESKSNSHSSNYQRKSLFTSPSLNDRKWQENC